MRLLAALAMTSLLLLVPPVSALADDEPDIEFFYPVVTRRPVIERELELSGRHEHGRDGGETELAAAIEWPVLSRWQIELEIPLVITEPTEGPGAAGFGDLALENKVLLYKSVQHRALVAAGFELTLPSGSERRGLGGELNAEPFVTAAIALGPFDLIGEIAYEWHLKGREGEQREQTLMGNLALAYPASRWFTPFLELDTVTRTSGAEEEGGLRLRDRVQIYLTPGFNVRPLPGLTFRAGVELPVTTAREFDYTVHAAVVWEF